MQQSSHDVAAPLRIGFVSVRRPLFKGDSYALAQRSLESLVALGESLGFEVIAASQAAQDAESAATVAQELQDQSLDMLLVQHSTFATGDVLVPLLQAHPRVALWAVPESAGQRGRQGPLPLNSLCGLNMTLSFLDHPQVAKREAVKWLYGEVDSLWFRERLEPSLAALRGLRAIQNAKILQVGGTAPHFYGIEALPELAQVQVDTLSLEAMFARIAAVPDDAVQARARDWAKEEPIAAGSAQVEPAARVELALLELSRSQGYNALALRCWPEFPEACGAMVCASVAHMGDRGIPSACEGDVMGALSMLALQGISQQASILMDISDLDDADDSLLLWHCGNAAKDWAAAGTRLTTHFNRDTLGLVRDMVLRPGAATGFRLLGQGQEALILSGAFGAADKASYDGVRGWLGQLQWNGQALSARDCVAQLLDYRLPHHLALAPGQWLEALRELCVYLGSRVLEPLPYQHSLRAAPGKTP